MKNTIKKGLTIPNILYEQMLRRMKFGNNPKWRKALYGLKKEFRFYADDNGVIIIARGNEEKVHRFLEASEVTEYEVEHDLWKKTETVNSKGEFNVPYGKYKTAMIFDEPNILAVSKVLQNAQIQYANYTNCFDKVNENTFVYFDPPYRPISQTASFTTYTGTEFKDKEQLQLAQFFQKLDKEKGAKLMLSNSDPKNENPEDDFFERAFLGYHIFRVSASRAVNCNGEKRGKINELLITNYQYEPQQTIICQNQP